MKASSTEQSQHLHRMVLDVFCLKVTAYCESFETIFKMQDKENKKRER